MWFDIRACSNLPSFDLTRFLNANNLSFNNLDWFSPSERFEEPGCFAIIEDQQIRAILAATPENPETAWLRFFYAERDGQHEQYFKALLLQTVLVLRGMGARHLFSLAPYEWLERLLIGEAFQPADRIVTLQRNFPEEYYRQTNQDIFIREMTFRDLAAVEAIDIAAFDPAWQLSRASLIKTYHRSACHTVAVLGADIVGYQMSTNTFDSAHLARLAVHPSCQRKGVGHALVEDMLDTFTAMGVRSFTVNTQASNTQSLKLYHSFCFEREDSDILVMSLTL